MIKTLRITSIIAAIAATGLLVLPAVYGVRSNPKIEELLKSPGVVEKFTSAKGQRASKDQIQNSPLVKQAVDLGRYFNPPPPPKPEPNTQPSGPSQPAPPVPVTAKFDLVATSYFASHPEQSFVLIDEPGKGQHWVKQGSTVGHLIIETVKDGSIVLRDGQRTSEMTVKVQESWRKLLKNPPPSTRSSSSEEPVAAGQNPAGSKGPENAVRPSPVTANKSAGIISSPNSRRNPRQSAMPLASEQITSPNQPPPAIGQPGPAEIMPPAAVAPQAATNDESAVELSPQEKERAVQINQLVTKTANVSAELTEEDKANLDKLVKLLEQSESPNSPDVNH